MGRRWSSPRPSSPLPPPERRELDLSSSLPRSPQPRRRSLRSPQQRRQRSPLPRSLLPRRLPLRSPRPRPLRSLLPRSPQPRSRPLRNPLPRSPQLRRPPPRRSKPYLSHGMYFGLFKGPPFQNTVFIIS